MRNLALVVEYDGTDFHGFAQQQGVRTVQGTLTGALENIFKHPTQVTGAGRTDAGAHAKGQTVNFFTEAPIPVARLPKILNRTLPPDIAIKRAFEVGPEWSARFSAVKRYYRYSILNRSQPSPFLTRYAMLEPVSLDENRMNEAAQALLGEHDFTAFTLEPKGSRNFKRVIFKAEVKRTKRYVRLHIEGTAFLRGQIRLITGVLVEIGQGKRDVNALAKMLDNEDAPRANWVVPACGLCLMKVTY